MGEEVNEAEFKVPDENSEAVIRYELSNEQRRIAREVKENYLNGFNTN